MKTKTFCFIFLFVLFITSVVGIEQTNDKTQYLKVKTMDKSPIKVDAKVQSFFNENKKDLMKVIVVLKEDGIEDYAKGDRKVRKDAIKMLTKQVIKDLKNVKVLKQFSYTSTLYIETDAKGLEELKHNPNIEGVYEDIVMKPTIRDSVPQIEADKVWTKQVDGINITGTGQTVCVVGTGIDYNHTAFGGAMGAVIIGGYDIMDNDNDTMDEYGHETGIAGVIASQGWLGFADYLGVAVDSKIVSMRVSNGSGTWADALAGIEWCIDNASLYNISVISYSSGTNTQIYDLTACQSVSIYNSWRDVILEAHSKDIMVVNSAGNTAGENKTGLGVHFPACIPEMIAVGGVSDSDVVDYYTHAGVGLDFLAPDYLVVPSLSGQTNVQGSSFATPQVSASIALLDQYSMLSKGYLVDYDHVIQSINESGVRLYDQWADENYSRINASGMIDKFIEISYPIHTEFTMNSTNFSALTLGQLDNISSPILENSYARVDWSGVDFNVDFKNIDSAVEFTNNSVVVNSNELPSFNTTANITLKGINYNGLDSYNILKNGQVCDDCVKISSNPVKFSVIGFSTYTTQKVGNSNSGLTITENGIFTFKEGSKLTFKI